MMDRNLAKTVLFLDTGNYDRSRYAEILFNATAKRMGLPWISTSRALALDRVTGQVGPLSKHLLKLLESKNIRDILATARLPQAVTEADFKSAGIVVGLNQAEHRPLLEERFPSRVNGVEYWSINDDAKAYDSIESEVNGLIARILGGRSKGEPVAPVIEKPKLKPKPVTVRVGRETKGRRGKGVTIIWDLPGNEETIRELATTLKQRCGTGGTVKDRTIEIQGDQRDRITAVLIELGFLVKRVGG